MVNKVLHSNYHKVLALGLGSLIAILLIYQLSISKTIQLLQSKKQQEQLLNNSRNLSRELVAIDSQLEALQASSLKTYDKKYILEKVTDFCHQNELVVVSFPSTVSKKDEAYEILTNEIIITGAYQKIVELIYLIEREEKVGSIRNIKFELIKNKKTKKEELSAKIVFRNLVA